MHEGNPEILQRNTDIKDEAPLFILLHQLCLGAEHFVSLVETISKADCLLDTQLDKGTAVLVPCTCPFYDLETWSADTTSTSISTLIVIGNSV